MASAPDNSSVPGRSSASGSSSAPDSSSASASLSADVYLDVQVDPLQGVLEQDDDDSSLLESPTKTGRTTPIIKEWPGFAPLPKLSEIPGHDSAVTSLVATPTLTLPVENIQGDIFVGMKTSIELFYFYKIEHAESFKRVLRSKKILSLITSAATLIGPAEYQPLAYLNLAFSQRGLKALGIKDDLGDAFFAKGQRADAASLGDNFADWEPAWTTEDGIHGVFLIGSDEHRHVQALLKTLKMAFGSCIQEVTQVDGAARPGDEAGHEHFGFKDGISNPAVSGFTTKIQPGQSLIDAGIILTGRPGDNAPRTPGAPPSPVPVPAKRPDWALDGSFLVFRKLQQLVPEWNKFVGANPVQNPQGTLTREQGVALFAARMVGRWKSGAPVHLAPVFDDPELGDDWHRNNNFDYTAPGSLIASDQMRCPFSAHTRKTRPRADLGLIPGAPVGQDVDTVNQAIRAGIPYGPEVSDAENSSGVTRKQRGLAFVEYQSQIGQGFRFQQVAWMNNANFPPGKNLTPGLDPVKGQTLGGADPRKTGGLDPLVPSKDFDVPTFIKAKGGEYFFSPSISSIKNKIAAAA